MNKLKVCHQRTLHYYQHHVSSCDRSSKASLSDEEHSIAHE